VLKRYELRAILWEHFMKFWANETEAEDNFYLCDKLKKVYVNRPRSIEEFQENSRHEIPTMPIHQLQRVSRNIA
jgi:hypothetical protein